MKEASKTIDLLTPEERSWLVGKGVDIGCGDDPIRPDVQCFDLEQGDANCISKYLTDHETYDYVFSSHCLEHMHVPKVTILDWWKLVRPGGVLFVIVPDEDLYEQGIWPSIFNPDHKATFTLSKQQSWSPVSNNLWELAKSLPKGEIVSLRLQEYKYGRARMTQFRKCHSLAKCTNMIRSIFLKRFPFAVPLLDCIYWLFHLPIDQTRIGATAQNLLIVRKVK